MTKSKNQEYMEYIEKIKGDNVARKVKLIDLQHNMDLTRLYEISDEDIRRDLKYLKVFNYLKR